MIPKSNSCQRSTSGGKGNEGMFIERGVRVCAAGVPSAQADERVAGTLQQYRLQHEVDALLGDALPPPPQPPPPPPLRKTLPLDKRNAGPFSDVASLISPPIKTKFQTLVDDIKNTSYSSYWKKPVGSLPDTTPMLPAGFDVEGTTFGKPTLRHGSLYDIVMPKEPLPDKTPPEKQCGAQTNRKYCDPPFKPDLTYGKRSNIDKRGIYAKCCLTDNRVMIGTSQKTVINSIQTNFKEAKQPRIGTVLAPNANIKEVPEGHAFGKLKSPDNLADCLTTCPLNPGLHVFRKCLAHLNSLRKCMSKRFLPTFFNNFYLNLKYFDKEGSGWLPKEVVYSYCGTKLVRFDPALIEPLLCVWKMFDGSCIEYKGFALTVLNYKQRTPDLPRVEDVPQECLDFRTTYTEMVKPGQPKDTSLRAGLPSGRYLDLDYPVTPNYCCKADQTCLPHESDMKACLSPSVMTLLHVNHRDMFAQREPALVRKVFEAAGESFTDEQFHEIWKEAQKLHSEGLVCFQTFREALAKKNSD